MGTRYCFLVYNRNFVDLLASYLKKKDMKGKDWIVIYHEEKYKYIDTNNVFIDDIYSKRDGLILDYGGNVERHGPVDLLDQVKIDKAKSKKKTQEPVKVCDNCLEYVPIRDRVCPSCDYVFPPPVRTEPERESSDAPITSDQVEPYEEIVQAVTYSEHQKNGTDGSEPNHFSMKVGYVLGDLATIYEWVCPQHKGYARQKFIDWWMERSICPVPSTVEEAIYLAENGALSVPTAIRLKKIPGKKFPDLVRAILPDIDEEWCLGTHGKRAKVASMQLSSGSGSGKGWMQLDNYLNILEDKK